MRLELSISPLTGLPAPQGAHELAWSYLLDAIFADAYEQRVAVLHLDLPHNALCDNVTLRAGLTPAHPSTSGHATALLGTSSEIPTTTARLYTLSFGRLAPRSLQQHQRDTPAAYREVDTLSAFSLAARLWGVPIRLAQLARRPDLQDRAIFAMRRDFARRGPCYYQLSTWAHDVDRALT